MRGLSLKKHVLRGDEVLLGLVLQVVQVAVGDIRRAVFFVQHGMDVEQPGVGIFGEQPLVDKVRPHAFDDERGLLDGLTVIV